MARLTLWRKGARTLPILVKDSPDEIVLQTPDFSTAKRVMEKIGYQLVPLTEQLKLFEETQNETTS